MENASPLVITISRQLGSGGGYIGQQLAKRLDIFYADREIISLAAQHFSMLEKDLASRDEKKLSFWQSFIRTHAAAPDAYVKPQTLPPDVVATGPLHVLRFQPEGEVAIAPFRGLWSLVALIVCWDLYVRAHGFNVIVLPDPLTVARALLAGWPTYMEKLGLTMAAAIGSSMRESAMPVRADKREATGR